MRELWRHLKGGPVADRIRSRLQALQNKVNKGDYSSAAEIAELNALELLLRIQYQDALFRLRPWLIVALVCSLIGVLVLLLVRQASTPFVARLTAPSLHIDVQDKLDFEDLLASQAVVSGMTLVSNDGQEPAVDTAVTFRLAREMVIQSLRFDGRLTISFLSDELSPRLQIHVECSDMTRDCGEARLIGMLRRTASPQHPSTQGPAAVELRLQGKAGDIAFLRPSGQRIQILKDAQIMNLSLLDVRPGPSSEGGPSIAWSGSLGGRIQLLELDRSIEVQPGEWLDIRGSRLTLPSLTLTDSGLSILVRGRSSELNLSGSGYTRDLRPTWLELLLRNRRSLIAAGLAAAFAITLVVSRALALYWGRG